MQDFEFSPVFRELTSTVKHKKLLTTYFGMHYGKILLLLQYNSLTIFVVIKDDNRLVPEFSKTVSSGDKLFKGGIKIVGNMNVILLLNESGSLWRLVNAFEFSNERNKCLCSLDSDCYYEWVQFKKFKDCDKVCDIAALKDGFACLVVSKQSGEKKLLRFSSLEENIITDCTFNELNLTQSHYFSLTNVKFDIKGSLNESGNEALIVTDRINGTTYIYLRGSISSVLYLDGINSVSVMLFEDKKCLLFCFKNGKLVFYFYHQAFDCSAYLPKKVTCIEKCNCCESCLIWSDGFNLHHTNIKFQLDKPFLVKLKHLKLESNISGVTSLLKMGAVFIAATINNFFYHIIINKVDKSKGINESQGWFLNEICQMSLRVCELQKEIKAGLGFLELKEMSQCSNASEEICLFTEGKFIVLKSALKNMLSRDFWQIKLSGKFENKHYVEMVDFGTDLSKGMTINIETDLFKRSQVEVSLVGNFENKCDMLFVLLGKVEYENTCVKSDELHKNLNVIANRRNLYFKTKQVDGKNIF